jgi:hypothetical protein
MMMHRRLMLEFCPASSSNINPFDPSAVLAPHLGFTETPWQASSASGSDQLTLLTVNYAHNSDDRNRIWNANVLIFNEYDYTDRI